MFLYLLVLPPVSLLPWTYPYPFSTVLLSSFLLLSHFFYILSARGPRLENVTAAILSYICCIWFVRGHRETAENMCWYSRPFNRVCPESTVSEKITFRSVFRCAGRGLAVNHPSTDPAASCLTEAIAWHLFYFLLYICLFTQLLRNLCKNKYSLH